MRNPETYVAQTDFKLPTEEDESIDIREGEYIKFDGVKAEVNNSEYHVRHLGAAIEDNWLVHEDEYQGRGQRNPGNPSAGIDVSQAVGDGSSDLSSDSVDVAEEEKQVAEVDDHEELREQAKDSYDNGASRPDPQTMSKANEASSASSQSDMEVQQNQDGQVVASDFKSPTKSTTSLDGRNASRQGVNRKIKETESAVKRENSPQKSKEVSKESPSQQRDKVSQKRQDVPQTGSQPMEDMGMSSTPDPSPSRTEESPVEPTPSQRSPDTSQQDLQTKTEESTTDTEDDGVSETLDPETKEGRFQAIKLANPELPDFDFSEHWATRMKTLREKYSDHRDMIRAVYAAESEKIKSRIEDQFSEYFDDA
jgi:hypothetical protein